MRYLTLLLPAFALVLGGCAMTGSTTSPNGDATSGNAQNVFNLNLNVDNPNSRVSGQPQQAGYGDGYQQPTYRTVPLSNRNPFTIRVAFNDQYVDLPPGYFQYVYLPPGPQTIVVIWPNGQQFPQRL